VVEVGIQVKKLSKCFSGRKYILRNLDFSAPKGQISGIIGPSGAGKSTLIRCLTLLESPTSGQIWVDNQEMVGLRGKELSIRRRNMGVIFQSYSLFAARTALENVLFPLEVGGGSTSQNRARAQELLKLVGLEGQEELYPAQLSGGQKQRVAIARALANEPTILLCDEPTSALDPNTTKQILKLLKKVKKQLGITIVVITHEMSVIREICAHVSVLDRGKIVESGSVGQVFTAPVHATTKKLLSHMTHEGLPALFKPEADKEVVRLSFRGTRTKEPIISQLIKQTDVEVNILLGAIDQLTTETIGNLIIELRGTAKQRKMAHDFLQKSSVLVEVVA